MFPLRRGFPRPVLDLPRGGLPGPPRREGGGRGAVSPAPRLRSQGPPSDLPHIPPSEYAMTLPPYRMNRIHLESALRILLRHRTQRLSCLVTRKAIVQTICALRALNPKESK